MKVTMLVVITTRVAIDVSLSDMVAVVEGWFSGLLFGKEKVADGKG
jgi:hypothetical protein